MVAAHPAGGGAAVTWLAAPPAIIAATLPARAGDAAALVCLALAVLTAGGRPGGGRLRDLGSTAPTKRAPDVIVRPAWVLVAAVAVGAVATALGGAVTGVLSGAVAGAAGVAAARWSGIRDDRTGLDDSDLAAGWELLAVCLEAGLPVAVAVAAAADPLTGPVGLALRRTAGLLELGADPATAWGSAEKLPTLATFARAAGRSASTGAALAQVARAESDRLRGTALDSAQSRAQRAGVLITGPLGLCFLPAFLVLGVAPVVIGLATAAVDQW
jgi:Flp pilus assembly protein TadB